MRHKLFFLKGNGTMAASFQLGFVILSSITVIFLLGIRAASQTDITDPAKNNLPNPNPIVKKSWGPLPEGRKWGSTAGVDIGPDGNIWAYDRCGAGGGSYALTDGCNTSSVPPILKFNHSTGRVLANFGEGIFVLPHGLHVDQEGNVWVTDSRGNKEKTKGHQVIKFSPDGKVLMKLGKAGIAKNGPNTFNKPCDVITAPNGDIFVADGHDGQKNNPPPGSTGRIIKFTKEGKYIKEWGKIGTKPGEFRTPHALAFDSRGRLFVADRGNNRIQIFDQEGNFIDMFEQFGRVSGLFIDAHDALYAIDSESNPTRHPGWKTGIRIGNTTIDKVTAFIPPHKSPQGMQGVAGEGVAVDLEGNVYAAEGPGSRRIAGGGLTKYLKR